MRYKILQTESFIFCLFIIVLYSCSQPLYDPPKSPEDTVASFTVPAGFTIEVFACEPFIADPVEMIFDQKGRIYAVEMPDYPFKPAPGEGQGKIKQLFDDDHDGKIDRSVVFADHISEATSIHPWHDGLLIAAAPNISWMRDNDGDGKADTSEIIFTGFFENNSEAQITNLKFMPDNWIYASNNGQGGEVKYLRDPSREAISVAGGDFRFRLDQDKYELVSGPTQFGQAFNDRIHRFVTQNTLHIRQPIIPWQYLRRNPYLPSKNATLNISDHDLEMFQLTPPPYWRAERTRRRQKSYDEQGQGRIEYAEDHFTGASGATFYGGHSFPASYYGSIFIGDVAGNLIHRDVLKEKAESPTYLASRAEDEKNSEFISSTDSWFRPANFTVGPDGFLYIIDMYRQHIETPLSIPEDLKEDMDFLAGSDRGRIYRVRPSGTPIMTEFEDLSTKTNKQLVSLLEHDNRWHRLHAHRMIIERNDQNIIPELISLFEKSTKALTRLHAFYCVNALDPSNDLLLKKSLVDPSPALREQAILVAESFPDALALIEPLIEDSDIRVKFQACLSIGGFSSSKVKDNLSKIYREHHSDPWFQMAILSSPEGSCYSYLESLVKQNILDPSDSTHYNFVNDLAFVIGNRKQENELRQIQKLLIENNLESDNYYQAILEGLLAGIKKSNKDYQLQPTLVSRINQLKEIDPGKWNSLGE